MLNYRISFFLLVVLLFVSCEDFFISEVENPDIPGKQPQLVVYSYISPQDTLLKVHVYRSVPYVIDNGDFEPVGDRADVYLAEKGSKYHKLQYSEEYGCFVISAGEFPVEPGKYYSLKVESYEDEKVEAECYVPGFELEDIEIDTLDIRTDEWGNSIIYLEWMLKTAKSDFDNYYRTGAYKREVRNWFDSDSAQSDETVSINYFFIGRGQQYIVSRESEVYDFRANQMDFYYYPDGTHVEYEVLSRSIHVFVLQTDYNYYEFNRSVSDYFATGDFPLAESVHIYSNIEGGLGVFAGYSRKDFQVEIPDDAFDQQ